MIIDDTRIKVSVIMPVLNGMPYFEKALSSVREQELNDIEIIVVDAGSTDDTLAYVSACMSDDKRIRIIKSDIKSHGVQCNLGMEGAKGKYIAFCENDDYMDSHMLYDLYDMAEHNNFPDCVKSNFYLFIDRKGEEFSITYDVLSGRKKDLYNKDISLKDYSGLMIRDINMWNGIFLKSFISDNNIKLNETLGASFQDVGFVQQVNMLAKRQIYVSEAYYHYRRDNEGSSVYRKERSKFALQECEYLINWLNSKTDVQCRYASLAFARLINMFVQLYAEDRFKYNTISYDDILPSFRDKVMQLFQKFTSAERSVIEGNTLVYFFLHNLEQFKMLSVAQGEKEAWAMKSFRDLMKSSHEVVIVTAGDVGQGIYATLVRNNWYGKAVFCDNSSEQQGAKLMGVPVLSVEQAVAEHPEALYIVNPLMYNDLSAQLIANGVHTSKVFCAPFICPHTSMEINFDKL